MEFYCIATAHFLALLSPGPDFFLILSRSLRRARPQYQLCCGIAVANGVHIILAVSGVGLLGSLMTWMKYLGGGYLIYLGVALLSTSRQEFIEMKERAEGQQVPSGKSGFCVGFYSALLNPKNPIFYLSLFSQLVDQATSLPTRSFYGMWMVGVVLLWNLLISAVLGSPKVHSRLSGFIYGAEKICGVLLASLGIFLPFSI